MQISETAKRLYLTNHPENQGEQGICNQWDRDFEKNHVYLARKIGDAIAKIIFYEIPTLTNVQQLDYICSLELDSPTAIAEFKEMADDAILRPPFREWLTILETEGHPKRKFFTTSYLNEKITCLGCKIQSHLIDLFRYYVNTSGNHLIQAGIQWNSVLYKQKNVVLMVPPARFALRNNFLHIEVSRTIPVKPVKSLNERTAPVYRTLDDSCIPERSERSSTDYAQILRSQSFRLRNRTSDERGDRPKKANHCAIV